MESVVKHLHPEEMEMWDKVTAQIRDRMSPDAKSKIRIAIAQPNFKLDHQIRNFISEDLMDKK